MKTGRCQVGVKAAAISRADTYFPRESAPGRTRTLNRPVRLLGLSAIHGDSFHEMSYVLSRRETHQASGAVGVR